MNKNTTNLSDTLALQFLLLVDELLPGGREGALLDTFALVAGDAHHLTLVALLHLQMQQFESLFVVLIAFFISREKLHLHVGGCTGRRQVCRLHLLQNLDLCVG